jgi:hypothetical protein
MSCQYLGLLMLLRGRPRLSADLVRCYRDGGGDGLGSMVVYDHTGHPTGEPNDYEIGKMAIHF